MANKQNYWMPATAPPYARPGDCSERVTVLSNRGTAGNSAYYRGLQGTGSWARPFNFKHGEEIAWWISDPIEEGK